MFSTGDKEKDWELGASYVCTCASVVYANGTSQLEENKTKQKNTVLKLLPVPFMPNSLFSLPISVIFFPSDMISKHFHW